MTSAPSAAPALTGMLPDELAQEFAAAGEPKYRASQVMDWVFQKRAPSYEAMTSLGKSLRAKLAETHPLHTMKVAKVQGAQDSTHILDRGGKKKIGRTVSNVDQEKIGRNSVVRHHVNLAISQGGAL